MPILIFDGPEKAGKSTLIRKLVGQRQENDPDVEIVDWGPVSSVFDYFTPLANAFVASDQGKWIIWDRSWASEFVYNQMTGRRENEPHVFDFLEQMCDRRGVTRYMILPPSEVLIERREEAQDETDLKVDPAQERYHFDSYATIHRWTKVEIGL